MGDTTGIEWTDATWNPTRGCRRTAPPGSKQSGCGDPTGGGCYAERTAARFCGPGQPYEGLITLTANGPRWSGKTLFVEEHLEDPLRWRKPRRIFVDSMSDLFYEGFTDAQIDRVFAVMLLAPRHTFQVLTKRADRLLAYMTAPDLYERVLRAADAIRDHRPELSMIGIADPARHPAPWIWWGTSVENQAAADERIPHLLSTPAAVRFLSCEPLLGPVRLDDGSRDGAGDWLRAFTRGEILGDGAECLIDRPRLDWIIAGCESGPGARPAEVEWFRSLRDQCAAAVVAFFLKQAMTGPGITAGPGSHRKAAGLIGAPYLDGAPHLEFPR